MCVCLHFEGKYPCVVVISACLTQVLLDALNPKYFSTKWCLCPPAFYLLSIFCISKTQFVAENSLIKNFSTNVLFFYNCFIKMLNRQKVAIFHHFCSQNFGKVFPLNLFRHWGRGQTFVHDKWVVMKEKQSMILKSKVEKWNTNQCVFFCLPWIIPICP